jgi:hypothetical protein
VPENCVLEHLIPWRRLSSLEGDSLRTMDTEMSRSFTYLYTAAPQPLYHRALDMRNIRAHWAANSELPDYFLGDFGSARFANELVASGRFPWRPSHR